MRAGNQKDSCWDKPQGVRVTKRFWDDFSHVIPGFANVAYLVCVSLISLLALQGLSVLQSVGVIQLPAHNCKEPFGGIQWDFSYGFCINLSHYFVSEHINWTLGQPTQLSETTSHSAVGRCSRCSFVIVCVLFQLKSVLQIHLLMIRAYLCWIYIPHNFSFAGCKVVLEQHQKCTKETCCHSLL